MLRSTRSRPGAIKGLAPPPSKPAAWCLARH
jgi:hypothetical protein